VTGKGVGSLYDPIYVVGNVLEEGSAVAVLESLEDFADTVKCNTD
jgi:hypothetical protein